MTTRQRARVTIRIACERALSCFPLPCRHGRERISLSLTAKLLTFIADVTPHACWHRDVALKEGVVHLDMRSQRKGLLHFYNGDVLLALVPRTIWHYDYVCGE